MADLYAQGFRLHRPALWLSGSSGLIIVLMFGCKWLMHWEVRDGIWPIAFAVLILLAADERDTLSGLVNAFRRVLDVAGILSDSSYTLYVVHFPLLVFAAAIWLAAGMAVLVTGLSVALSRVIERPFFSLSASRKTKT